MLISILTSLAWSFAPSSTTWIGVEPNRQISFDLAIQNRLRQQQFWKAFTVRHPTWKARFDESSSRPYRMWGAGIDFDCSNESVLLQEMHPFLMDHNLTGLKSSQLTMREFAEDNASGRHYLQLQQVERLSTPVYNDLTGQTNQHASVWRRGVEARFQNQKLTMLGVDVFPFNTQMDEVAKQTTVSVEIEASEALRLAMESTTHNVFAWNQKVELVWLPLEGTLVEHPKGMDVRLSWAVRWDTQSPRGQWVAFVDVETGTVWNVHNEVRYLEGTLLAEHDERTVGGGLIVSPLTELNLDGDAVRTDFDGAYTTGSESESINIWLDGRRTRIYNQAGEEATLDVVGGDQTWVSTEDTLPELDQYVFQNQIYAWSSIWAPQIVNNWTRSTVYVNEDDVCNAYFDGELHFYRAGGGCNNTGRIADVSYHEWGHGFHYYNLLAGEYDGSMSEGIADAVAFFQTGDNEISPNFGSNGAYIRDVEPNYRYPEDIVNEVHQDGLIFAGSVWDWWQQLRGTLGDVEAYETVMPVFVLGLRGGPTIPTVFDEFIFADDDNADLSDGTPNQCSLVEAFGLHGLGPNGGAGLLSLTHEDLTNQDGDVPLLLEADIVQFAAACLSAVPEEAFVVFSWDGGLSWDTEEMTLDETLIEGEIPKYLDEGVVQYYLELLDSDGNRVSVPPDGDRHPFSLYVGDVEEVFCTDFESDDGGFTHSLLAGDDQEGADDWQWGIPNGLGGDPDYAASGDNVWGNDLGGEVNGQQYNGEYQNDKRNQLLSPNVDVSDYEQIVLTYDRWLSVEDGAYDQAHVLMNGDVVWQNHATSQSLGEEHHRDQQWQNHSILLDVDSTGQSQFSWEITSDRGLTMGGWNIDNVCVYGIPKEVEQPLDGDDEEKVFAGCQTASLDVFSWSILGLGLLGMRRRR